LLDPRQDSCGKKIMSIRILIADDHAVFRSGLRVLLEREPDMTVVGEAASFSEIAGRLASSSADVLIMDLSMPGPGSAPRVVESALKTYPHLHVVVLTMHEDDNYLREMFRFGAQAYVLKKSDVSHVLGAVRSVYGGARYVDPALGGEVVAALSAPASVSRHGAAASLTAREQEVCALLALGHTNAEIGDKLCVSVRTVETHRSNIMAKLHLRSRAELVRFAIDSDLLKLG
jgi:two-component system response regulator NreC